jgi:hypothetical protein
MHSLQDVLYLQGVSAALALRQPGQGRTVLLYPWHDEGRKDPGPAGSRRREMFSSPPREASKQTYCMYSSDGGVHNLTILLLYAAARRIRVQCGRQAGWEWELRGGEGRPQGIIDTEVYCSHTKGLTVQDLHGFLLGHAQPPGNTTQGREARAAPAP